MFFSSRVFGICAIAFLLVPASHAKMRPSAMEKFYCGKLFHSEPALSSYYGNFRAYTDTAFENLQALSPAQIGAIFTLDREFKALAPDATTAILKARLSKIANLTLDERVVVRKIVALDEPTVGMALDQYRKNFQYLFWSDHSWTHAKEIVERSRELDAQAPAKFRAYFSKVLENRQWIERIDRAIRLHDSRMFENRRQHAELVLGWEDGTFPREWSEQEKALTSVLAMLHSKSAVPYDALPRWKEILREKILPSLLKSGKITEARSAALENAIHLVDADEMARAASWLRIADAARPLGEGLRNSSGHPFVLTENQRGVRLVTPRGSFPVVPAQLGCDYGQVALGSFRLIEKKGGGWALSFPLRLEGKLRTRVLTEIQNIDVGASIREGSLEEKISSAKLSEQSAAVLRVIADVLGDFPPELAEKTQVELR